MQQSLKRGPKRSSAGQLRIIAGRWRGRRFPVLDAQGLRPTGDRIRETLFNWLSADLAAARCLDLYAGSGALGLEALSRGAARCDFVERDREVAQALRAVLATLQAGAAGEVHEAAAEHFLGQAGRAAYDLVFLDPPFTDNGGALTAICAQLHESGCLAPEARIYLEFPHRAPPALPASWHCLRERSAGAVGFALYAANPDAPH